jgi:hypothetical protein
MQASKQQDASTQAREQQPRATGSKTAPEAGGVRGVLRSAAAAAAAVAFWSP